MRSLLFICIPALLVAQAPAPTVSGTDEWLSQLTASTDKFESERIKLREKFDKNLGDLDRREKAFLALSRDEFGMSEASRMDPQAYARAADSRQKLLTLDDSSASQFIAARRSGNAQRAANATVRRMANAQRWLAHTDTALKYAKETSKSAQRSLDRLRAEDKPGISASRRAYIKRLIDYYDNADRVGRARATFYGDYSEMLRKEIRLWEREIASIQRQ